MRQLLELNEVPKLILQELGRQEDVEGVRLDSSKGKDTSSPVKMGPNASANMNAVNAFSYKPKEIMQNAMEQHSCPVKLDQRKKDRVREVELQYFVKKYLRKSPRT